MMATAPHVVPETGILPAGMPPALTPSAGDQTPWQSAFVAYARGFSLAQISDVYGIPKAKLERRALDEHWSILTAELPIMSPRSKAISQRTPLARLESNRAANLRVFTTLRNAIEERVLALQRGELKIEKVFHSQRTGETTVIESNPQPADLVALATAAKLVAEGTYRALGDAQAVEGSGSGKGAGPTPPAITVLLPGFVMRPEGSAPMDTAKPAQVVDVTPETKSDATE